MNKHDFGPDGYCTVCGIDWSSERDDSTRTSCTFRLAVVGSRTFHDYDLLSQVLGSVHTPISIIVSGGAKGADSLAEKYALEHDIDTDIYLPDWDKFKKTAGFVRNYDIVANADAVVAFWDGKSRGTMHTVKIAEKAGLPVYIKEF